MINFSHTTALASLLFIFRKLAFQLPFSKMYKVTNTKKGTMA